VHGTGFGVKGVTAGLSTGTSRRVSATCTARLAGTRLAGRCSWRIPLYAERKRLSITVRAGGLSRSYTFRVR
jgi:hypothetical protein